MAGTYTKLYYHIVFSTKSRHPFVIAGIEQELHKYISGIIRGIDGICIEINGMPDHCTFSDHLAAKNRCFRCAAYDQGQLI